MSYGRPDTAAGLELSRSQEPAASPTYLAFPIRSRGRVLASLYLERGNPAGIDYNNVVVDTLANLLAVTVQRLVDTMAHATATGQRITGLEFKGFIGTNPKMSDILAAVVKAAREATPVLITGEPGTGRSLLARALHESGSREGAFVTVNCSGMPENLLAGELFGSARGTSGARPGKIEAAAGGTAYLAEIGDLSLALQARLLRVLDRGVLDTPGRGSVPVDVRLVAGTSRSLQALVRQGFFSGDLYRRLSSSELAPPPLRERKEDIPRLVRYFIEQSNQEFGRHIAGVSDAVLGCLLAYTWPGNLRELQNVVERAVLLASGPNLELGDFPEGFLQP